MFCLQLPSVLTLFSSLFCLPGVFRARWARRRRCRLSSHPVCPCSAVFLCLLCASRRLLWRWGGPSCCGFRGGLLCVGGLWACVGRPSGRWSCAAGCPPRGLFGSCPGARRCASPVTLGVGLCRALASSVWSLRCAFAVASCSVRSGLRFAARCVSSVGSVRSVVSLPLSGGGIAVRSERLLSRPLLSSLCAGWSGVAVAFVSWTGDRCWGSLGRPIPASSVRGSPYPFCWRRLAWWTGLGAPLALLLWRFDLSILPSLVLVCRLPWR